MKRPGYREAIAWIANNDDTEWLLDEFGSISVTAALVADLFDVSEEKLRNDLNREIMKARKPQ